MAFQKIKVNVDVGWLRKKRDASLNFAKSFLKLMTEVIPPNVILSLCNFLIFFVQVLVYLSNPPTGGGLTYFMDILNIPILLYTAVFVVSMIAPLLSRNFIFQVAGFLGFFFYTLVLLSGIQSGYISFLGVTSVTYYICIVLGLSSAMAMQAKVSILKQDNEACERDCERRIVEATRYSLAKNDLVQELRIQNATLTAQVQILKELHGRGINRSS